MNAHHRLIAAIVLALCASASGVRAQGGAKPETGEREKVAAAFATVLSEKSINQRLKEFLTLLENLEANHAPAVFELLRQRGQGDVSVEMSALMRRWGALDPQSALKQLDERPGSSGYNVVLSEWAAADPVAAMMWVKAHQTHPQVSEALPGVISGYARRDLDGATRTATELLGPDQRLMPRVLADLATAAADNSADTLKTWYARLPSDQGWGPLKGGAALRVYELLPKGDYMGNARWVGACTGSLWHNGVITRFASDYAQADPEAAMNWVQTTKPKPDNHIIIGVGEIVKTWSQKDMPGLGRWLEAHRLSPVFNQVTRDLAVIYTDSNRDLARYWGEQNTDPARRAFIDKLLSKPPNPSAPPRNP